MRSFLKSLKFWVTDTFATRGHGVRLPENGLAKAERDSVGPSNKGWTGDMASARLKGSATPPQSRPSKDHGSPRT
ncbi:MAG: hypothetical protein GY745_02555 [Actinomycetia bacterium]|nr:hypothetical protein [Actinomycetes bacterium]